MSGSTIAMDQSHMDQNEYRWCLANGLTQEEINTVRDCKRKFVGPWHQYYVSKKRGKKTQ